MRIRVLSLALQAALLVPPAQSSGPTHVWSRHFSGATFFYVAPRMVTDASGNIYLLGSFAGTVDFGGGPRTPVDAGDYVIVSFDANGTYRWDIQYPTAIVYGIGKDPRGGLVVGGYFEGTLDLGGTVLTSEGEEDCFVAKLTSDGQYGLRTRIGGPGAQKCNAVSCDADGNVVITGSWEFAVPYYEEFFAKKIDSDGNELWTRYAFETDSQSGEVAAFDPTGDVVIGAHYLGAPDFGGGPLIPSGPFVNVALVKYAADGTHLWSRGFGDGDLQNVRCLDMDPAGNVWITGSFDGSVDFGGGEFYNPGNTDMYVASFDSDGRHRSSRQVGAGAEFFYDYQYANSIAVNAAGDALVAGFFNEKIDLGGGVFTSNLWGAFAAKYTPTADHVWSRDYGIDGNTLAEAIAVDEAGNIILAGWFDGSVDFGGGVMTNHSGVGMFVAKFTDETNVSVTVGAAMTSIGPNYPNPFNPKTTIEYSVGERMPVAIEIFDVSGALVARLDQGVRAAGTHRAEWDGRNTEGRPMGSGVYFCRLSGAPEIAARKMVLLK